MTALECSSVLHQQCACPWCFYLFLTFVFVFVRGGFLRKPKPKECLFFMNDGGGWCNRHMMELSTIKSPTITVQNCLRGTRPLLMQQLVVVYINICFTYMSFSRRLIDFRYKNHNFFHQIPFYIDNILGFDQLTTGVVI